MKAYSRKTLTDYGLIWQKRKDSLANTIGEEVRDAPGRRIRNQWPRKDGRGQRGCRWPELREGAAAAMASGVKLVGAAS